MTSARDTLADWISDVACPLGLEHEIGKSDFSYADSILAALDAAGFKVIHISELTGFIRSLGTVVQAKETP